MRRFLRRITEKSGASRREIVDCSKGQKPWKRGKELRMNWNRFECLEPGQWSSQAQRKTAEGLNKRIVSLKTKQRDLVETVQAMEAEPLDTTVQWHDPRELRALLLMEEVAMRQCLIPWLETDCQEQRDWIVAKRKEWETLKDSLTGALGGLGWKVGDSWDHTDTAVVRAAVQQHPQVVALLGMWNVCNPDRGALVRKEEGIIESIQAELMELRKARVI
jgi:hypothetical protein